MAHKHIQGQNVYLKVNSSVLAASESCDFSITANTADAAAKDDPGLGEWDNPQFESYSWSCSNQSFIVNASTISTLLGLAVNGSEAITVEFGIKNDNVYAIRGNAFITSLEIDAPADGFAKINISLEGASALTPRQGVAPTAAGSVLTRIKGKALMMSIRGENSQYLTAMCATGHKLTVSVQTTDIMDKDSNDKFKDKEITGRSIKITTDNLIPIYDATDTGAAPTNFISAIVNGTETELAFGYYPDSLGQEASHHNWCDPGTVMLSGIFLMTSFSCNGQVKNNATYSAEFSSVGSPSLG